MASLDISAAGVAVAGIGTLQDDWFNGLTGAATRGKIKARWDAKAGTDPLWQKYITGVAKVGYRVFIDDNFESRRSRTKKQINTLEERKLAMAAASAKTSHDDVFANNASKFVGAVNNKAGKFSAGIHNTLAATGCGLLGATGIVPFTVACISSDPRALAMEGGTLTKTGDFDPRDLTVPEHLYTQPGMRSQVRAGMEGYLTQLVVFLLQQVLTNTDFTEANGLNTEMTTALKRYLRVEYQSASTMQMNISGGTVTILTHLEGSAPITPP